MEQELNQVEATTEQATEKPSEPVSKVTPPEAKTTSERTYSETEWRKMQSMKDTADAKTQKLERENLALRDQQEQQRLVARQKEIADLEGDTDGQAKARKAHQLEDNLAKLEKENANSEGAVNRKYDQAIDLATQYNLSLADARELMKAETPKEMELQAQLKVAEQAKVTAGSPPTEFEKPDSGTSDAGTDTDKAFQEAWNSGELPATKENLERAKKILNK